VYDEFEDFLGERKTLKKFNGFENIMVKGELA